jgi:hypothetical protein
MARRFLTALDLGKNELQNAAVQSLAGAPGSPVKFQLYGNTTDNTLYWWDGAQWIAAKAAAGATPAGTVTTQAYADAGVVGVSTNFAREDHKHGMPAVPVASAIPFTPGGTVAATNVQAAIAEVAAEAGTAPPAASETVAGVAEIATQAEVDAEVDDTRIVTPNKMEVYVTGRVIEHMTMPANVHPASAITFTPTGTVAASDVQAAIAEVANDAQAYADALVAGLSFKEAVRAATTANGALASAFQNGAVIDGVTLATGNRILIKDQSTGTENGIYTVNASGAPTRANDANAVGELEGAYTFATEGTVNGDKAFVCSTNGPITPGTTATTWVLYNSGTTYTAGNGLTLTGADFAVVGDASITVTADAISRAALTGDVTATAGANGTTIANGVVSNAKLATMAANTFKGNNTGGTAAPTDLTVAAMQTALAVPTVASLSPTFVKLLAQDCAANVLTTVTHNFNTRDVKVEVYRNSTPWDTVDADVERPTVNTVDVRFATAPAAGAYRIVVEGIDL